MRKTLNALYLVVILACFTACQDGSENDIFAEAAQPTQPTQPNTTSPSEWTTVYGGDASMDSNGFVQRYLLIARQDSKSDSVASNYNVVMTLKDTTRIQYSGTDLELLGSSQSLFPTGNESYTEGTDHVLRATEKTGWDVYCGAVMVPVSIERQLAKVIVRGKETSFEFGTYRFEAEKVNFRIEIDTVENKIYRKDILDGKVHMRQGYGDYAKPFVIIMDRGVIGEVETPKDNPMPSVDILLSGAPTMKGQFMLSPDYNVTTQHVTSWTTTFTCGDADKFVVYNATNVGKYELLVTCPNPPYTNVNTATKQNGKWVGTFVEKGSGKSFVYKWGTASTECWTLAEQHFCAGGAANLQEDGKSRQTPIINTVYSNVEEFDNGYRYTAIGKNNTGTQIYSVSIGWYK